MSLTRWQASVLSGPFTGGSRFLHGDFHRHGQTLLVGGSGLAVRSPLRFLISFASRESL